MNQQDESAKIEESIRAVLDPSYHQLINQISKNPEMKNEIEQFKNTLCTKITAQDKDYLTIRGLYIFQLFQDQSFLSDSSKSRKQSDNIKRRRIWNELTTNVNEKFEGVLNVVQVKKLAEYWKNRHADGCFVSKRVASILSELTGRDTVVPSPIRSPLAELEKQEMDRLISRRIRHIVGIAKLYMKVFGIDMDTQGRSKDSNCNRMLMWVRIHAEINSKYSEKIGEMGLFQMKKVFSNYKRRHPNEFGGTAEEIIFSLQDDNEDDIDENMEEEIQRGIRENEKEEEDEEDMELDVVVKEEPTESIEFEMKSEPIDSLLRSSSEESENPAEQFAKWESIKQFLAHFGFGAIDVFKMEIA